jgi:hypothetical protein
LRQLPFPAQRYESIESIITFNPFWDETAVMKRLSLLMGVAFVATALLFTVPLSAFASSGPILTTTYTLTGPPQQAKFNGLPCIKAGYLNALGSNTTFGVVYGVVHNSLGQTVLMATATLTPAAGANATAFLIVAGLPSGVYSTSVFAVDQNDVAISVSTNIQITL